MGKTPENADANGSNPSNPPNPAERADHVAWLTTLQGRVEKGQGNGLGATEQTENMHVNHMHTHTKRFDEHTQAELVLARHWRRAIAHKLDAEADTAIAQSNPNGREQRLNAFARAHAEDLAGTKHTNATQTNTTLDTKTETKTDTDNTLIGSIGNIGKWIDKILPSSPQGWAVASVCAVVLMAVPVVLPLWSGGNNINTIDGTIDSMINSTTIASYEDPTQPQYRGDAAQVQTLPAAVADAASPLHLDALQTTLQQLQAKCRTVVPTSSTSPANTNPALRIECKLPKAQIVQAREQLQPWGVAVPDNGILILVQP